MNNKLERILTTAIFSTAAIAGVVGTRVCLAETVFEPAAIEATRLSADQYLLYYPELRNLSPSQMSSFETNRGTRIHWINYTDSRFIEETLKRTFSYFQDNMHDIKEELSRQNLYGDVNVIPSPQTKNKLLFIVPENVSPPRTHLDPGRDTEAATAIDKNGEAIMTFIRHAKPEKELGFPELEDLGFNLSLATEACQQAVMVVSSDGKSDDTKQEQICNSLGAIFAVKQTGLSYFTYQDTARTASPSRLYGKFLIFSEELYNKIPRVGRVLSSR